MHANYTELRINISFHNGTQLGVNTILSLGGGGNQSPGKVFSDQVNYFEGSRQCS